MSSSHKKFIIKKKSNIKSFRRKLPAKKIVYKPIKDFKNDFKNNDKSGVNNIKSTFIWCMVRCFGIDLTDIKDEFTKFTFNYHYTEENLVKQIDLCIGEKVYSFKPRDTNFIPNQYLIDYKNNKFVNGSYNQVKNKKGEWTFTLILNQLFDNKSFSGKPKYEKYDPKNRIKTETFRNIRGNRICLTHKITITSDKKITHLLVTSYPKTDTKSKTICTSRMHILKFKFLTDNLCSKQEINNNAKNIMDNLFDF